MPAERTHRGAVLISVLLLVMVLTVMAAGFLAYVQMRLPAAKHYPLKDLARLGCQAGQSHASALIRAAAAAGTETAPGDPQFTTLLDWQVLQDYGEGLDRPGDSYIQLRVRYRATVEDLSGRIPACGPSGWTGPQRAAWGKRVAYLVQNSAGYADPPADWGDARTALQNVFERDYGAVYSWDHLRGAVAEDDDSVYLAPGYARLFTPFFDEGTNKDTGFRVNLRTAPRGVVDGMLALATTVADEADTDNVFDEDDELGGLWGDELRENFRLRLEDVRRDPGSYADMTDVVTAFIEEDMREHAELNTEEREHAFNDFLNTLFADSESSMYKDTSGTTDYYRYDWNPLPPEWESNTFYPMDTIVRPTDASGQRHLQYKCITVGGGTSGGVEPTWADETGDGAALPNPDGTVDWECRDPRIYGLTSDAFKTNDKLSWTGELDILASRYYRIRVRAEVVDENGKVLADEEAEFVYYVDAVPENCRVLYRRALPPDLQRGLLLHLPFEHCTAVHTAMPQAQTRFFCDGGGVTVSDVVEPSFDSYYDTEATGDDKHFYVPGKLGDARHLRGIDSMDNELDFVRIENMTASASYSVAFWFNANKLDNDTRLLSTTNGLTLDLMAGTPNTISATMDALSVAGGDVAIGEWHYLAATWRDNGGDNYTLTVYLDGASVGTTDGDITPADAPFTIDLGDATKEAVDELRWYGRALPAGEVRLLYQEGR